MALTEFLGAHSKTMQPRQETGGRALFHPAREYGMGELNRFAGASAAAGLFEAADLTNTLRRGLLEHQKAKEMAKRIQYKELYDVSPELQE